MSLKIELLEKKDEHLWKNFVEKSDECSIYHTIEWRDVIQKTYKYEPLYIVAKNGEELVGIMPTFYIKSRLTGNRLVSLPFSYLGGPISKDGKAVEDMLTFCKIKFAEMKCKYIEIRSWNPLPVEILKKLEIQEMNYYMDYRVELFHNTDVISQKINKSNRRATKKAIESNVTVEISDDMEAFFKLNLMTRKKHGVPSQPRKFFDNITSCIPKEKVKIFLAKYEGKVIAGIVIFISKDTLVYAYGASDDKYLGYRPNNLLLWTAIEWGAKNNFRYFDFARTSAEEGGLLEFKKSWGSIESTLPYYFYPSIPKLISSNRKNTKYKILSLLWRKIPNVLYKPIGSMMIKHIG